MPTVSLHDGSPIAVEIAGSGPSVLMPVNPVPAAGARADELRKWGVDPSLGRTLIDALSPDFRVVAFDYEGHVMTVPKPATLTAENIARDFIAVAEAAGAATFAYYGYSWLALTGFLLALRSDRLWALAMGLCAPRRALRRDASGDTGHTRDGGGFS